MVLGKKSNDDRLLAVYNADKFTLEESFELEHLQGGWGGRAPLVLRLNRTGTRFLFVVNHLLRDEKKRRQQAHGLNIWADELNLPIITVGDYNFDLSLTASESSKTKGFNAMTANEVFVWIRPNTLVQTHCHLNKILDFAFVANGAKNWRSESRILWADRDCKDTKNTSDHRPIELTIDIP